MGEGPCALSVSSSGMAPNAASWRSCAVCSREARVSLLVVRRLALEPLLVGFAVRVPVDIAPLLAFLPCGEVAGLPLEVEGTQASEPAKPVWGIGLKIRPCLCRAFKLIHDEIPMFRPAHMFDQIVQAMLCHGVPLSGFGCLLCSEVRNLPIG